MLQPMRGVRVLEVAQFTFVPAAGAVLADWGAEVIKVEHAEKGDAQRGLTTVIGVDAITKGTYFNPVFEGPNRGKRSVGLALDVPEAREVLDELIKRSDVFLTNYLPSARAKLHIDLEDVRKVNPGIIYVRGSGFGARGPEADKGGYDMTAFWARSGSGAGATPAGADRLSPMPAGAYGDNIGGMTIAGGIAAALFARATTGETSVVDVSLLGVGAWATSFTVNLALQAGGVPPRPPVPRHGSARNPLVGPYQTSDGRWVLFSMLQPGRYWPVFCQLTGHPELAEDERFNTVDKLMANAPAAGELVAGIVAERPFDEWPALLDRIGGQWATVQDAWGVANDASLRDNGMIASLDDADGVRRQMVTNPVQFDETPAELRRGPLFAEHTDEVLRELGLTDERLIELKIAGAVT
jgi:crotonobetainyl-CoA:carnitine CoA-transferase CaiB-like acyl-CoA transferase